MKKNNHFLLLFLIGTLVSTLFAYPNAVSAQTFSSPRLQSDSLNMSFEELGFLDFSLHSPFDSNSIRFTVPPNWQFSPGGTLSLNYDVLLSGPDLIDATGNQREFGGTVSVLFNRQVIDTIYIESSGSFTLSIPIPDAALESVRPDGRHELEFNLLASESCEYDIRTSITIKSESFFTFPYETFPPALDLARMPYPFYPVSAFLPNQTVFVMPAAPDLNELKAAMNLFSGFGSMAGSDFQFDVVTPDELTEEQTSSSNLVFVGMPDKFEMLSQVEFPQPVSNGQFANLDAANAEDGIIQFANSPWNADKAILFVSGATGEAVNKAAQAISTGEIFAAADPRIVYVSAVHPYVNPETVVESFSFRDQGYRTETFRGFGTHNVNVSFYLPKEQVNSTEASIDLKYLSNLFANSRDISVAINLNDSLVAAIDIVSPTENLHTSHIAIPPGLLKFGENRLELQVILLPTFTCDPGRLQNNFVTILDDSVINIPVATAQLSQPSSVDLSFYPDLFLSASDLSDITFALPQDSPSSWRAAAQIAQSLGRAANPNLSALNVVYGDNVSPESLADQNLIIVGRASTLPIVNEINESLPAPFDFETDTASEDGLQISYRVPPETSLGYLELTNSPFENDKILLVVSGNTDSGIELAGDGLTLSEFRSSLAGHFAVTNGVQMVTTRAKSPLGLGISLGSVVGTVVPGSEPVVNTPFPQGNQQAQERPAWLLPVFIISAILVVFLLIRYLFNMNNARKASVDFDKSDDE